jgi:spermidine/putrescine transport system permease protein
MHKTGKVQNPMKNSRLLLLFPPFFWLTAFFLLPLVIIIVFGFSYFEENAGVRLGFTIAHYRSLIDPLYARVLLRSLGTAAVSTLLSLLAGFIMAYYLAFSPRSRKPVLLFLLIVPFFTNLMIRLYAMTVLFSDNGLINKILLSLHVVDSPVRILSTSFAVYIGFLYWNLPFMVLPIYASLDRMDVSLIEASLDLGAGRVKTFCKITLPYALPGIFAGIIFCFVPTLGCFIIPDVLGGKSDIMIGNIITDQFIVVRNWPFGSAISTAMIVLIMFFVFIYIRYGNREEGV